MNIEELTVRLDCLCSRVEDVLAELQQSRAPRPNPYKRLRETYPNAGKPWSEREDEELRRLADQGTAPEGLATVLGRTPKGVRLRLEHSAAASSA